MPTIPSLSQAFSALGNLFKVPAASQFASPAMASAPAVPSLSAPQIGPSALSSLQAAGVKPMPSVPAVPKVSSAPAVSAAAAGSSLGGRSVMGPNGPGAYVPYPGGAGGAYTPYTAPAGGASLAPPAVPQVNAPNATSVATGQPVFGPSAPPIPNATSVVTKQPVFGPSAPAVPSAPTAPTFAAPVTGPSGATFDPNTGGMVSSGAPAAPNTSLPIGSNTGNQGSAFDYSATTGGGAPGTSSGFGSSYGGSDASLALGTDGLTDEERRRQQAGGGSGGSLFNSPADQAAYDAYQASLQMSPEEQAANKQLADLNTAAAQAYTNTQGQPIALPFITGQMAALQREQGTLAQPLEAQLSLAQARRQIGTTAAQAALSRQDAILAAKRDMAKPISTAYGGTLSKYNPQTGQYETVVNPFGTASGTTSGAGGADVSTTIGNAIANGQLTSDMVTRYGIPFIAATLASDPGYNFITQKSSVKSDTASLTTQQAYADSTSRAFNTANANLGQLVNFMTTAGVNAGSNVPLINELQNKVKAGLTDPGTIAAYQAALAGLRAEYAQVLSRGGEVTEGQRAQAASLIPDNLTPAQLQQVTDRLKIEGSNAITEANAKVKEIQARLKSNPGSSGGSSGSSSSSSIYDF